MPHISEAAPLQISRFYTGLFTHRNPTIVPIRQMGRRIIELYDAIFDGLNMECNNRLTLSRRPGYTAVSPFTNPNSIYKYFYSFKPSNFPGQIYQIADATDNVWSFQPGADVRNTWTPLIPKPTSALTNFASVGAYCYMAQEAFAQKWDSPAGVQGVTNWGIDMYQSTQTQGPNIPHASGNQGNGSLWTWEGTPFSTPLTTTVPASSTGVSTSAWLNLEDYRFNYTFTGVLYEISGIQLTLSCTATPQVAGASLTVRLVRNGGQDGTHRTVTLPTSGNISLGSPSDTWDAAWTFNDINQAPFGVAVQAVNTSTSDLTFTLAPIEITVYSNYPASTANIAPPAGQTRQTPLFGWFYKYCYGNSHSGHVSSPTPPSFGNLPDGLTNPGTNAVQVSLTSSLDPQVDLIHVYRTTDGGGNPYFELPNSPVPNGPPGTVIGLTDFADDTQLQIANICPDPHFNDPPAGGATDPVWFAGRLWLHRGNQLFFSSGPDTNMGNEAECWYPVYVFSVPAQIIRKFATPNGLLLVCLDEILIVRGISTASFTVNDFVKDIGMRTWSAADSDGTNIYLYSSDRQFLLVNANGFNSIGANVADRISAVDPTLAYVCQYRFGAYENLLFLGDGSTTLYPYNLELNAWNTPQQPDDGVGAISTIESSPGVYQFWRAQPVANSTVTFRDLTSFSDEGIAYPCYVIFGAIPVADYLTIAQLRDIVLDRSSTTSQITLSAIANEISPIAGKQFEILAWTSSEPPDLSATPSLSHICDRFTWKSTTMPEFVNLLFMRIDFSANPNADELFVFTIGGTQTTGGSSLGAPGQLPQLQGR